MDKPAKPDDKPIDEAGDKDGNSSVPSAVETFHVEPIPDFLTGPKDVEIDPEVTAKLAAAIGGLSPAKTPVDPLPQLPPQLPPEPTPTAKPADIGNLPIAGLDDIEDIPPPLPPKPEISFAGVDYVRCVHSLPILGYACSVEPVVTSPESPEEANRALSRVCDILAGLHARMGDPGDMRGQIAFCIAGEELARDRLIDCLPTA